MALVDVAKRAGVSIATVSRVLNGSDTVAEPTRRRVVEAIEGMREERRPGAVLLRCPYVLTDYCALFWSEDYWRTNFDTTPPGLIGAGSGVGVGQYYLGPLGEWHAPQDPTSIAYTRKDFSGFWTYYPDEELR